MQRSVSRKLFFALFAGAVGAGAATESQAAIASSGTIQNVKFTLPPPPPPPKHAFTPLPPIKQLVIPNVPKGPDLQSQINALNTQVLALQANQSSIWNNVTAIWGSFNNVGNEFYKHFHTYESYNTQAGQWQTWGSWGPEWPV
jgi:hypothetical protein